MTYLESTEQIAFVPQALASFNYSKRIPKVVWSSIWILLNTDKSPISWSWIDVVTTTWSYIAYFDNKSDWNITGTGIVLASVSTMWWKSCNDILLKNSSKKNKDWIYYINPDWKASFQVYCDMTTAWGGWTLVANFRKTWEPYNAWFTGNILNWENWKLSDNLINLVWKEHFKFEVVWKIEKLYCKNFIFDYSWQTKATDLTICSRKYYENYNWYITNRGWGTWYAISHWNARDFWIRDNGNSWTRIQLDDGNVIFSQYDIKMYIK